MRRKLFRWPVIVAAICGLLIFISATFITAGSASAQEPAQDETSPTINCEILSANPLNWFGCPIITGLQEAVTGLNAGIDYMLTIKTTGPGGLFEEQGYRRAWDSFRIIAIGLIIVAGLIMLASQAFGFEIFDAYTVKKLMPRLVISVIFIVISWDLLRFLVELSNTVGNSVRALIYQPFVGFGGSPYADALEVGDWSKFLLALITGAAIFSLGLAAILSFAVTAALAVALAFLILLVRQMIVVLLVIFAPVAIALYVLPGTQKAFDFWKGTLISMLVVFPIISAMIAVGRVFALIAYGNPTGGGIQVIQQLSAFVAYFVPYFLLPFAFRLAGGAIATLSGIVNDRGRGGFDRLKGYRGKKLGENVAAMKAGNRFEGRNFIPGSRLAARGINRTTSGLATGLKGNFGVGERGRQALDQKRRTASDELMKSAEFQAIANNDDALMAATYGDRRSALQGLTARFGGDRARAERAVQAANASIGYGRPQAIAAAQQMVNTGTGYDNMGDMVATLARASGGNTNTAAGLAGYANSATKKVGRHDLAPGFGALNNLVQQQTRTGVAPSQDQILTASIAAARGVDNATLARDKNTSVTNHSQALTLGLQRSEAVAQNAIRVINNPTTSAAARTAAQDQYRAAMQDSAQISAKIENMRDSSMYGPEVNVASMHANAIQPTTNVRETVQTRTTRRYQGTDAQTRQPVYVPNASYEPVSGETYNAQRQNNRYNPDDPRNQP